MADDLIPSDVKQFIVDKIDSVAELEGLLLLRRDPKTEWGVEQLAQRLYINRQQTEIILSRLLWQGFLAVKETTPIKYHYQPKSPKLAEMVDVVADIYSKYLVPVTNMIHSKPEIKVQQFADAFKIRKQEGDK
jgi:hypothetical protein